MFAEAPELRPVSQEEPRLFFIAELVSVTDVLSDYAVGSDGCGESSHH